MNRQDLIDEMAARAVVSKRIAEYCLNAALESIEESLKRDEKVQLVGFGSFEVKQRSARIGRNPHTKEAVEIAARRVPIFTAGKHLKEMIE